MEPKDPTLHTQELLKEALRRVESGDLGPKEALQQLEASGLFLFHGTNEPIRELEPRQPYTLEKGQRVPHGDPSVCLTPYSQIAIFRALVNRHLAQAHHLKLNSSFGSENGEVHFTINTSEALAAAQSPDHEGYVIVCSREGFQPFSPSEWRSGQHVTPQGIVKVTGSDLPLNIEIRDRSLD